MSLGSPWWNARRHADRRPTLLARGRILQAIREYFTARDFTEVECGALAISPGNEAHLHAFATEMMVPGHGKAKFYLHTSPEFACKKLLAERGPLHAPEFTMLEWYRANEPYDAVIADCLALLKIAAAEAKSDILKYKDRRCDPHEAPQRISVADAFGEYAKIDLLSTLHADGTGDAAAFTKAANKSGVKTGADDSWSDIFSRILVERVEPHLGQERPTILDHYPRVEAALARACADDARVAERFEIYACGVELANGFGELTDAKEQRKRFEAEMDEKERVHGERYPIDEDFLLALAEMPQASGVALGFDRLVMLATAARRIDDVMWTPPIGG
jgi:elongation factor P--(R)-beta-lysine ligase